jgi:hypothetical protein
MPPDSRKEEALNKAIEAKELYDSGEYAKALRRFTEADDLYHTIVLVLHEARCQDKLGKLVEANNTYQRVLGEKLTFNASARQKKAQAEALLESDALQKRIPRLRVFVRGAPDRRVRVWIDGSEVVGWTEPRWLNPGRHRVVASAAWATSASATVDLDEGMTRYVDLYLHPAAAVDVAPKAAPPKAAPPKAAPPKAAPPKPSNWPAEVTLGAGVAGLFLGTITGIAALYQETDKQKAALGITSGVAFAIGGLGVTVGAALLVDPGAPKAGQQRSAGMTGAALYGTF